MFDDLDYDFSDLDYEPVEESYKKMNELYHRKMKRAIKLVNRAKKAKTPQRAVSCYKEALEIVARCRASVAKMGPSFYDEMTATQKLAISIAIIIGKTIGNALVGSKYPIFKNLLKGSLKGVFANLCYNLTIGKFSDKMVDTITTNFPNQESVLAALDQSIIEIQQNIRKLEIAEKELKKNV